MTSGKNIFGKDLDKSITSDDILGKEVIDKDGAIIGVAEKVFFDSKDLEFIGIAVDKGLLKKGVSIGKDYIARVGSYAVFLNISLAYEIRGRQVFDKEGAFVGKVKDIELKESENSIAAIIVTHGISKITRIDSTYIETIGNNVILNLNKKEIVF